MKIIDNNFFDIIDSFSKPFKLENIYKKLNIEKNNKLKKDIETFFEMSTQFVLDEDLIYPKNSFLKNINLQIIPTEFEINNDIFIIGHRIIPFQAPGFNVDNVNLYYNNNKLQIIEKKIDSKEINIYFSLLDLQNIPIKNFHDVYFNDVKNAEILAIQGESRYMSFSFRTRRFWR